MAGVPSRQQREQEGCPGTAERAEVAVLRGSHWFLKLKSGLRDSISIKFFRIVSVISPPFPISYTSPSHPPRLSHSIPIAAIPAQSPLPVSAAGLRRYPAKSVPTLAFVSLLSPQFL